MLPPRIRVEAGNSDARYSPEPSLETEMRRIVESIYGPPVRRLPGLDVGRAYWGATKEFRYGGAVVDISGHGIRAARHAALAKYALRAYASRGLDALASIRALNRLCIENSTFENEYEFFATAFFAILDARRQTMQYVSAGHEAAYVITPVGPRMLGATGPIVGLMDDDDAFSQETVQLDRGDIFAAVTDGFTEARDAGQIFLGPEPLVDIIEQHRAFEAEQQAEAVTRYARDYAGERLQDDIAALVVKIDAKTAA